MRRLFVNKGLLALFLICLSLFSLGMYGEVLAISAPSRNSVVTPGGQSVPCTFDVYQDGSFFLAKNCKTGDNDYSSTDFVTTLNNALSSSALGTNGGTVVIEDGSYTISNTIQMYQSSTILMGLGGAGRLGSGVVGVQGVSIQLANSVNKDMISVGNTNGPLIQSNLIIENAVISNIAFDGNKANNNAGDCIHGFSWSGGGVEYSTIHNCVSNAIELQKGVIANAGAGCCLNIGMNTIEFAGGDGITENGNVYDFIHYNQFEQTKGPCINLISTRHQVVGNNLLQCGFGNVPASEPPGVFVQSQYNLVEGNYFENIEFDCIKVNGQANTITNNRIDHCGACNVGGCGFNYSGIKLKFANATVTGNIIWDDYPNDTTVAGVQENTAGATTNIIMSNIVQNCLHTCSTSWLTTSTALSTWFGNTPLPAASSLSQASPYRNIDPFTEILIVTTINGATALICNGAAMGTPTLGMTCTLRTGQTVSWSTANPTFSKQPQ